MNSWVNDLRKGHESSISRTYSLYKTFHGIENYLKYISKPKFSSALSKLRASSHDMEIERRHYIRPKLNRDERLCMLCHVIEDGEHFVTGCMNNLDMRESLFKQMQWGNYRLRTCSTEKKIICLSSVLQWSSNINISKFMNNTAQLIHTL